MTTTRTNGIASSKPTFVLHTRYAEQVDMLNDTQAGMLFRAVLHYADTGLAVETADPAVNMMFSFIRQQMDADYEKYEETCKKRSEAASRAGKISAEKRALKKQQAANATNVNDCQRIQHDNEYDYEDDSDNEYDNESDDDNDDEDDDYEYHCAADGRHRRPEAADDTAIVLYGRNQWPVMQCSLEHYTQFANTLTRKYMGRAATVFDIEKVMEYASRIAYADEQSHMVCDTSKADLLQFVFDRAAEQERVTWKYIDGIISNYRKRGVETVEDAVENEYSWNRGEIIA